MSDATTDHGAAGFCTDHTQAPDERAETEGVCHHQNARYLDLLADLAAARAALDQAWFEGWTAGCNDQQYGDEDAKPWTPNPYRAALDPEEPR